MLQHLLELLLRRLLFPLYALVGLVLDLFALLFDYALELLADDLVRDVVLLTEQVRLFASTMWASIAPTSNTNARMISLDPPSADFLGSGLLVGRIFLFLSYRSLRLPSRAAFSS